jgi:hypothetical protein
MNRKDRQEIIRQLKAQHDMLKNMKKEELAALRKKYIIDVATVRVKYEELTAPVLRKKQYQQQIEHSAAWTDRNPEKHNESVTKYYNEGGGRELMHERYWSNPDYYNAKQRERNAKRNESNKVRGDTEQPDKEGR